MDTLSPPTNAAELREAILEQYDGLSKRLQQIARYVLDEPDELALETLAVIAERSGVQPSAIVRFAKFFGFEGASQMQRLFREGLVSSHAALGYNERVRKFTKTVNGAKADDILSEFVEGNILALHSLKQTVASDDIRKAVQLVQEADTVYVAGFRRSFPVSSYLAYSLQQTGKRTIFVSGVGGMTRQQLQTAGNRDLLIAVSFSPYSAETVEAAELAVERGARLLSIADSPVSPIAKLADCTLQVRESEIRTFRTLSASLCLAQALVIGFAFESSKKKPARKS
jgi:DNA-binding MurR/RpiR family transcriptional regulator